jgi:feruloyl esterase
MKKTATMKIAFSILFFLKLSLSAFSQEDLIQIRPFGANSGNLKLMFYDPGTITAKAPLVVVLHGCTQVAKTCAEQTGWNKLAKINQFYVLYPEQLILNNAENCFNWFRPNDQTKDKGEPASIIQMIEYLKKNKNIDSTRIYITGLSAGGAMSTIMLSVFPQVFDKGAVIGGGPYKSAQSAIKGGAAMLGMVSKSPEEWGDLVKEQNPNYKGSYPELLIFHGAMDPVVSSNNANQLIKQWVNINETDYREDEHYEHFNNNEDVELTIYKNAKKENIVHYFRIRDLGHAIAIDTGNCDTQGGKTGLFSKDKDFHSTFWQAYYFGILKEPYHMEGLTIVKSQTEQLNYSVPFQEGSTYKWQTPAGVWVTKGQNTNSITVSVDTQSGYIEVTETNKQGCKQEPCKLWVKVKE